MKMVRTIICSKIVSNAVKSKLALGYTVTKTTNCSTKENPVLLIISQIIKAKSYIGKETILAWYFQGHYSSTIGHNLNLNTCSTGRGVDADCSPGGKCTKGFLNDPPGFLGWLFQTTSKPGKKNGRGSNVKKYLLFISNYFFCF